jgi:peptide/nickel transport system ATP-binding protein
VHPYTRALLQSIPVLGRGRDQDIQPIAGSTPDPYDRPSGCQFAPRCKYRVDACDVMPDEVTFNKTQRVMCWRYQEFLSDVC